ncbi:MAG TPA: DUF1045 domain-containing protein [Paracoccus sp. (in: a-proteobacteria)]|uniref:DUF1045 domain-containing protein n=1 Tax=Paracoccus sp. TaxID=267 RepID=UPI002C7B8599|nr:DUF1045 domain-containing protein [Paracoccus sp. (in: a-proteobacteria)]HWL56149.1 DUF1045 domain-containing protein [Paracoccus sp. (in: a-proteobacteria)]
MKFARFAIYHLPEGELGDFGAAWLGWDARTGKAPARPEVAGLQASAAEITSVPRRYGFHATLKAPFRLAEGHSPDDLVLRTALICDHLSAFALDLGLSCDWGFVALRPLRQPVELVALEQALVTRLDDLRAPLTPAERERRKPDALPEKARAHLDHWGYPFVLDLFNYHLTLSKSLPRAEGEALVAALGPVLDPLIRAPMQVRAVSLVGEDAEGRMHRIEDFPLRG